MNLWTPGLLLGVLTHVALQECVTDALGRNEEGSSVTVSIEDQAWKPRAGRVQWKDLGT